MKSAASERSESRKRERGARVPRAQAHDAALQGRIYVIVDSLASELRAALPAHPDFAELDACMAVAGAPSDRCQTLIADVINYFYQSNGQSIAWCDWPTANCCALSPAC